MDNRIARHFTRAQLVETAKENRDLTNPVWHVVQDELQRRDELDKKRTLRRELREAKKGLHPYGLQTDKPKKQARKYLITKGKKGEKMAV